MEHIEAIVAQQKDRTKPPTGRAFLLSVAGIVLRLAVCQIIVNALILLTGAGLLNAAFYLYAVWLLVSFMRRTVAGYTYTLKATVLLLQRESGDSTTSLVEIPLDAILAVREVAAGERLRLYYRQVTAIDPKGAPGGRMRLAFALSLISARLARLVAGKRAGEPVGSMIVYEEEGQKHACTFRPNGDFLTALGNAIGDRLGVDDREAFRGMRTVWAQALQRAFPALYPTVEPFIDEAEIAAARQELRAQRTKGAAREPEEKKETPAGRRRAAASGGQGSKKQGSRKKNHDVFDDTL